MVGKKFIYKNIRVDNARHEILFDYRLETSDKSYEFTESLILPIALPDNDTVNSILRALHIALGISYYKATLPPLIDHGYDMDESEAEFWNLVFTNGLGEFLYKNNLEVDRIAKFSEQSGTIHIGNNNPASLDDRALLGIGGGKDSIVAGELLKDLQIKTTGFVLATGENRGQALSVSETMGVDLLAVERRIDPKLLKLNKIPGTYNGHVPISLIFALVGCMLAIANGSKYVIVANEASASIPDLDYNGMQVNHQWSKSIEFEKLFQDYVHVNISKELDYFSIIRQLSSVGVAKIFSKYPKYFEVFTSDNSLFKINQAEREHPRWSKTSSKSLSSYILMAPWLTDEELDLIFGHQYLDDETLSGLFYDLLGAGEPVLDCVGTPEELRICVSLLAYQGRLKKLVIEATDKNLLVDDVGSAIDVALKLNSQHEVPENISNKLQSILEEKLKS